MSLQRHLHLIANLGGVGSHEAAWRLPRSEPHRLTDIGFFQEQGRIAERGKLDAIFVVDFIGFNESLKERAHLVLEPVTVMAGVAAATGKVGLMATGSTTYNDPHDLARIFATLDHVSGGRAAWNIVTSGSTTAARNFGDEGTLHADRYNHADSFVETVLDLWDSWNDDARVADREKGVYVDLDRVRRLERRLPAGLFNIPRSPQGHPVLMQAGSSDRGRSFAARHAEVVMTAQPTLKDAQAFYADVKARAAAFGRRPETVKIMPGIQLTLASTEAEAKRLKEEADELLLPGPMLDWLIRHGIDLTGYDLDAPLPADLGEIKGFQGIQSRIAIIASLVETWGPLTVRQLTRKLAGGRGHPTCIGTPEQAADIIAQWFREGAADGFVAQFGFLPDTLAIVADQLVPELQRRGLYREDYEGETLRDHLGLARPSVERLGGKALIA